MKHFGKQPAIGVTTELTWRVRDGWVDLLRKGKESICRQTRVCGGRGAETGRGKEESKGQTMGRDS